MFFFEILPELRKTDLIAIFKVTVCWIELLDCIVCEVHPVVGESGSVRRVLAWTCSDVAFLEEIAIQLLRNEYPNTDIKFATLD